MLHVEDEESQFAAVPISVIPKSDLISPHTSYNIIQEHEPSDRDFVALVEDEEDDAADANERKTHFPATRNHLLATFTQHQIQSDNEIITRMIMDHNVEYNQYGEHYYIVQVANVPKYRTALSNPRLMDATGPSPPRRKVAKRSIQKLYTASSIQQSDEDTVEYNSFTVSDDPPLKRMLSFKSQAPKIIIDSGASTCGTGQASQLQYIRASTAIVTPAFGTVAQPTQMGDLPPYMLKTLVIEDMKDSTLLSVSQICATGQVAVFTSRDCRFYTIDSALPFLRDLSQSGKETIRGTVENGLYVQEST